MKIPIRHIILLALCFSSGWPKLSAQKLSFDVSKYDVLLHFYQSGDGDIYDTLHYDSNLLLTDNFSIYQYISGIFYPLLKGKFKNGKLIDSIYAYQNEGKLYMRGHFAESNLLDTFSYSEIPGHTATHRFPGVKSGKFIYYASWAYEKTRIENYLDGKLNGEVIDFKDGHITHLFQYQNGMKNGIGRSYIDKSPIVKREWNYCNDTLCGTFKEWYSKDTLFQVIEYKKGWAVSTIEYWNNGNLWRTSYRTDTGKKDSIETEWYKDGQLWYIKNYKSDLLNGKYEEYYYDGQIKIQSNYLNDSLDGKFESWHENGKIAELGYFKRGNTQKGYKRFDENGKKTGEWSNYGNHNYWGGFGHEGVIDGVYIKENLAKFTFDYTPTLPVFIENDVFTRKEKRLLKKYGSLDIELALNSHDNERYYHGYIFHLEIKSKIKKKHLSEMQSIIRNHLNVSAPFMVGEFPARSVLHGTVKFD